MLKVDRYLLEHDIKPSVQRIAIMDYLMKNPTHPTVDEIYHALSPEMPTLSKTTVYNTLKLFTENGAALSINIEDKNVRFDGDTSNHAHFICLKCGHIFDLQLDELESVAKNNIEGFSIKETHLYYRGHCPECKKED